jgi:hypothetical protein
MDTDEGGGAERDLAPPCAAWNEAIAANDVRQIAQYMADDWVLVTPESGVVDKSRFLGAVGSGELSHAAISSRSLMYCCLAESKVLRIRDYGASAVLTARGTNNGLHRGQPFQSDAWIRDVFVRRPSGWLCALPHLTPALGDAAG